MRESFRVFNGCLEEALTALETQERALIRRRAKYLSVYTAEGEVPPLFADSSVEEPQPRKAALHGRVEADCRRLEIFHGLYMAHLVAGKEKPRSMSGLDRLFMRNQI
ncbi:hypothetical protein [Sinorhizobium meliloti]|uniref:hypothetical protein n=1 Tax=Rhizobium meliloti TaxID=382 RepID=UPI0013E34935|nr:hypothetical protein [Sinorhizobium meliloti]